MNCYCKLACKHLHNKMLNIVKVWRVGVWIFSNARDLSSTPPPRANTIFLEPPKTMDKSEWGSRIANMDFAIYSGKFKEEIISLKFPLAGIEPATWRTAFDGVNHSTTSA